MPEPLDKLEAQLRAAVSVCDYARAGALASEYVEAVRRTWESLAESDRAASLLPQVAQELLTWSRGMTIVQRAIASEQLAILQKVTRYKTSPTASSRESALQVRG